MKKIALLMCLFALPALCSEPVWRVNYTKGLQYISEKKYEDGIAYLKMAAADKPISEIVQEGNGNLEYFPYLQLGICYFHLGKVKLANEFLELENSLSAIHKSKNAMDVMKDYKDRSSKTKIEPAGDKSEKAIRSFDKKPYVLPEEEVQRMKEDIRQRCNLPRADERTYPWYYHYELGLGLKQKNDWQRALDSFISALDYHDRPQRFSRIYGMWFIDYYPYYNIGLAHFHLRNWKCAQESFRLSQMLEDLPKNSRDYRDLVEMKSEVEGELNKAQ